jgi:hypothetical protein
VLRRVRRKWLLLPAGLLLLMLILTLGAFVRGTWADTERRIPATLADGPVCHVYQGEDGAKEVRCAIRLASSMDEVWEAITDYVHFGDICSCIHADRIAHEPDGSCQLEARVLTLSPGWMPFAVQMRNEQKLHQYTSSWDQPSGSVTVNRGRWTLTELGPRETLLEVSLEIQVQRIPTFILRNLSLGRLREVALNVQRRMRDGPSGKPW